MADSSPKGWKTLWEKEKLLVVLQTRACLGRVNQTLSLNETSYLPLPSHSLPALTETVNLTLSQTTNLRRFQNEMKEFADDKFKFDENGRMFSNWVEKDKLFVMSNFSFPPSVFKGLVLQIRKTRACLGKG